MTSINGETGKNGFKLRLDYEVTKQSTADNKSTVHMVLYLYANTTGSYNQDGDAYWSINGKKTYYTFSYTSPAWYVLGERTEEISHNNDGTKTVTLSGVWCSAISGGWAPYSLSVSGEVTLPTIPRATTPGIGGVTMGETAHISLPRASSGFTHTLRYVFGGAAETIATGVTTGYDWLVPESLAAQIPDAASGKGTLTCETYSGSTLIGTKSVTFTASVPGSMKPTVLSGWAAVSYDNSGTAAENMAAWVQGYSKARATFDASKVTCRQGAGVSKFSITYLGKTTEGNPCRTETISTTGATVRCTVTDSRGLTAWEDFNIALLEYAPPALVGADLFRSDGEGTAADGGAHIAGMARVRYSELGGLNSVTLKGYWKSVGGGYGAGETLTVGTVGLVTGDVEISADRSYIALLVLTDSLGNSARYEENIPTEKVAFHLKEGGKGAAFGKAAETEGLLELAEDWHLKLTGATDLNAAAEKIAVLDPGGVVRYRTKAELQGDLAADYIVSQGTSGIWTYRKWASGVAECWLESELTLTGSTPVANMNGSAYLSY
uniref:DUF859 family phage minor structural protein n=1 Tax=Vescimonas sp. TaxID=2892404 RepID=UPI00307C3867